PYAVDDATGTIARQYGNELSEGTVYQVESTHSPAHDGFVIAIEDGAGNLKVIDYHVDAALDIDRDYSSSGAGGAIDDVAITTVTDGFSGVVTAELAAGTGQLVLRSFEVPAAGGVTLTDTFGTFVFGDAVSVDTVPWFFGLEEYIVTAVIQASDQTLRLDTWELDASGQISWIDTISAGAASTHDAAPVGATGDLVSVVRDAGGDLRMIGWGVDAFGDITRTATRVLGPVTDAAVVAAWGG
ncbi:MAG: hypothetical protein KDK70_43535, partial [Myxococcales bacterium]|nr:hypothetical protein [Myxococcales bacterium]